MENYEKWKSHICDMLYQIGEKGKTITYKSIIKKCDRRVDQPDLIRILEQICTEEFEKHGIFITVLAVRNHGIRLPHFQTFEDNITKANLERHRGLKYEVICTMEQERTLNFLRERVRERVEARKPKHDLF